MIVLISHNYFDIRYAVDMLGSAFALWHISNKDGPPNCKMRKARSLSSCDSLAQ